MLSPLVPYVSLQSFLVARNCSLCYPLLFLMLPTLVPYVTHSCSLCYPHLFLMLPTVVPYVPRSCYFCYPQSFFMLLTVVLNVTSDISFPTLEMRRELEPNFVLRLVSILESLLGTRQLTIRQFLCPHQTTYLSNLIRTAVRSSLLSLKIVSSKVIVAG